MVPGKVGSDTMTLFSGGITVYERIVMNRKVWVISGLMIIALGFSVSAAPVHDSRLAETFSCSKTGG